MRSRRWILVSGIVVSLGGLAGERRLSSVHAQDPPPPPVLSGTVRGDGSTPPIGFYPHPDRPEWIEHATAYLVHTITPIAPTYQLPLGNPVPKDGTNSFSGTVPNSAQPQLFEVSSRLPGRRFANGNMNGSYIVSPYFITDKEITCNNGSCSSPLDVTLHAKWGNVAGRVLREDGTPVERNVYLQAYPSVIPPNGEREFRTQEAFASAGIGRYTFAEDFLQPPVFYVWRTGLITSPWDPWCDQYGSSCNALGFDKLNNWGLRVLGDGGVRNRDKLYYSNTKGSFTWKVAVLLKRDGKKEELVTVRGSETTNKDVTVRQEDILDEEDWPEKYPEERDPEDMDDRIDRPCGAVPRPVSVIPGAVFVRHADGRLPALKEPLIVYRNYNSSNKSTGGMHGRGWSSSFEIRVSELSAQVFKVQGAEGGVRFYTDPDGDGVLKRYGQPSSAITTRKTATGYVRSYRSGLVDEFRTDGRISRRVDRAGRATVFNYNTAGQLAEVVTPEGRRLTLEYGGYVLSRLRGPEGVLAEYSYGYVGTVPQLTGVRYPDGTGYQYAYDSAGRLETVKDLAGVVLDRHGYDAEGRAAWSELNGGRERYSLSYGVDRTTVTDARGNVSVFEWERRMSGRYITKITGCGFCGSAIGTRTWERDAEGRITRHLDANGKATTYTYAGDDLASVTNALGHTTIYGNHDAFGRPGTITRSSFGTTTVTYVPEGVKTVQLPGGQTTTYDYLNGRLRTATTGTGDVYTLTINALGEVEAITDPRNKTWIYTYDAMGRVKTLTRPDQAKFTYVYDVRGRVSKMTWPDGRERKYSYDRSGRLESMADEGGRSTRYTYDAFDRPESVVDPLGGITRVEYDVLSQVTALTDAKGQTTRFEYDEVGRVKKMTDPMSGFEEYTYYSGGDVKTRTDRKGVITTYVYDDIGRLTSKTYSDGTPALSVGYNDTARTMTASNGTDTLTWTFDVSGRLLSEASTLHGSTVSYTYDNDHRRATLNLNGSLVASYGYEAGFLKTLTADGKVFTFSHDDVGRRSRLTLSGDGPVTTYDYEPKTDWLKRIATTIAGPTMSEAAYTYDAIGNRLTKALPQGTETYVYDEGSRLVSANRPGASPRAWSFGYDLVGNRLSDVTDGVGREFSHDARNRLQAVQASTQVRVSGSTTEPSTVTVQGQPSRALPGNEFVAEATPTGTERTVTVEATDASGNKRTKIYRLGAAAGSATYQYDANGNLTQKVENGSTSTYTWNAENELVRVTKDGAEVARFEYDPLGRRVRKIAGGVTYAYLYDGMDILRETRTDGTSYTYIQGPGIDEPLVRLGGSGAAYYHVDGLGSIVKMTDASGNVIQTRQYDAWGNLEVGASEPGYAFTGREWDAETGLYYYRARYYNPKIGRFLSEDPIGWEGGLNQYAYVENNPINLVDPSGEAPKWFRELMVKLGIEAYIILRKGKRPDEIMEKVKALTKVEHVVRKPRPGGKGRGKAKGAACVLLPLVAPPGVDIIIEDYLEYELWPEREHADPTVPPEPTA